MLGQDKHPSASAKNLGVVFDSSLNFLMRKSLSLALAKQIAVALVSSKLDYCNSLFHNIAEKDIARSQRVQNCLAGVVTKAPRFSRVLPILNQLHWLPVKFRIHFKICTKKTTNLHISLTYLFGRNAPLHKLKHSFCSTYEN